MIGQVSTRGLRGKHCFAEAYKVYKALCSARFSFASSFSLIFSFMFLKADGVEQLDWPVGNLDFYIIYTFHGHFESKKKSKLLVSCH